MSAASSQASAFYEQVAREGVVFTFTAGGDYLVLPVHGREVVPFWSSRSRIATVQADHQKYAAYDVSAESLSEFLENTLPLLRIGNICVGMNWSGTRLSGYDLETDEVLRNIGYWLGKSGILPVLHASRPPGTPLHEQLGSNLAEEAEGFNCPARTGAGGLACPDAGSPPAE